MPAPEGNRNGEATWFKPLSEKEPTVIVQTKVPKSVKAELRSLLEPGETESSVVRDAILRAIAERRSTD